MNNLSKYQTYRHFMKTGDIIEFSSNTMLGKGIRLVTGKHVNHTAKVIRLEQYDVERIFLLEALEHGIVLTILSTRLQQHDGKAFWRGLAKNAEPFRLAMGQAALSRVGTKYDYKSILKQLFAKVSIEADKLFCSEFVYWVDFISGAPVKQLAKSPWPGEFGEVGIYGEERRIL